MPHDHGARIGLQGLRAALQVMLRQVIQRDPLRLTPQREGAFKGRPA